MSNIDIALTNVQNTNFSKDNDAYRETVVCLQAARTREKAQSDAIQRLIDDVQMYGDPANLSVETLDALTGLGVKVQGRDYDYRATCNMGGMIDTDASIYTIERATEIAYERVWEELQALILRGTPTDFREMFTIHIEEV